MAQGQSHEQQHEQQHEQKNEQKNEQRHVGVICNDGTVVKNNSKDACAMHSGVRVARNRNRHVAKHDVDHNTNHDADHTKRDKSHSTDNNAMRGNQGGMTTAQMMAELHIDHTKNNATARCQDGFYYNGQHDRSACSHDGGVSAWYK
jgi:hypothetical protein